MFLGIEVTTLDFFIGVGLGIAFLGLFFIFMRERKERRDEQQAHHLWRDDAYKLSDDVIAESIRREEAEAEQESLRTQLEEADGALDLACEDLANAEEEIEELEEESDGFEESTQEAVEQLTIANDLVKHTLAWSERVLDVAEERTPR